MFEASRIREILESELPECTAIVEDDLGDGEHFSAVVTSEAFVGLNLVKQHQLVYGALGDLMKKEIHALALSTLTPEQWANRASQ
jgi:acid stress-induced BolA-like protein IbaG/YrbA